MDSLKNYQLYLFDYDGLLVNTEEVHFNAYKKMCNDRGFELDWNFSTYCLNAHYDTETLRNAITDAIPELKKAGWDVLYEEKKRAMLELLDQGAVHLMPGANELLQALGEGDIPRCVVTNSPAEQVELVKAQHPILQTIPHWFTRGTYNHPKPHPECYVKAIRMLAKPGSRIIGFEDTPRGLRALMQTPAKAMMVTAVSYPEIPDFIKRGAEHVPSLDSLFVA